jgi:hypothetical protein
MIGMTTKPIDSVLPLARSWNYPAEVEGVSAGYDYLGYDQYQRSYLFKRYKGVRRDLEFELLGTETSPVVDVPVVIRNWGASAARIEIDGMAAVSGVDCLLGFVPSLEGDDLVIWIYRKSTATLNIKLLASHGVMD